MNTPDEKLHENYEDALFALLFNNFAEVEGARLIEENTKIKDDPNYRVPTEVYKSCKRTINQAFFAKEKAEKKNRVKKNLLHVAVAIITFAVVFSGMYFSVSAVRESISNILKSFRDSATVVNSDEVTAVDSAVGSKLHEDVPIWQPEGFTLSSISDENGMIYAVYFDTDGNMMVYKEISNNISAFVDTEDADIVEYINIGDCEGAIVEKNGVISITWFKKSQDVSIRIKAYGLDRDTVIKLADSANNY